MSEFREPWRVKKQDIAIGIVDADDDLLVASTMPADREPLYRRIVACVNFCREFSTETLEKRHGVALNEEAIRELDLNKITDSVGWILVKRNSQLGESDV